MKQVVVSDYINSFVQNFLLGGFGIAILGLLIEFVKSGIAYSSYIYSALPTVYFFFSGLPIEYMVKRVLIS